METSVFKINKMIWKVCSKWDRKCWKEYGGKARSEIILMVTGESVDHIYTVWLSGSIKAILEFFIH